MKKQILSLILALAMVLSMSVCAFAAAPNEITKRDGTADVPLNGEITDNKNVALISVVVPTSIDFQIGTEEGATVAATGDNAAVDATGRKFVQLVSATGTVVNNTASRSIKLEVTKVVDDSVKPLLEKVDLALAPASTSDATTALASYKLVAGTGNSYVLSNSLNGDGGTLDLKVFGEVLTGTASSIAPGVTYPVDLPDCKATVTATLKVTLNPAN